jgi:hypothetical protein
MLIIEVNILNLVELFNCFSDSLLHQQVINKHESVFGAPSLLDSHLYHKLHVCLSEIFVKDPLLGLIRAVGASRIHTSHSVSPRINQWEIVQEVEYVMRLFLIIDLD